MRTATFHDALHKTGGIRVHAYRWRQASRPHPSRPAGHCRPARRRDDRPRRDRTASGRSCSSGRRTSPSSARPRSSAMASSHGDFEDRDAVLIGASTDTAHVHFAWRRSDEQLAKADFPWIADNQKELAERARHSRSRGGRRLPRHLHRRPRQCHPACHGQRPQCRPQPGRDAPRPRRAADRRVVPVQLDGRRRGPAACGLRRIPPRTAKESRKPARSGPSRGARRAHRLPRPFPVPPSQGGRQVDHVPQGLRRRPSRLCEGPPAQRRLAAQRPDARRPAQIRPAPRLRARHRLPADCRRRRGRDRGQARRGRQRRPRGGRDDGDEQRLLPLRPPRLEPGLRDACRRSSG